MFIENQIPDRQEDEKLLLFLRRHPLSLISQWLIYTIVAIVPIAAYSFLNYAFPEILINRVYYPFLFLFLSVYYLFTALFFFNAFIDYHLDVWLVTSKRIINIEQKGLFNRVISEQTLDRIQDVTAIQKGFWQTFFNFGDVQIQTAGKIERFIFFQVPRPFEIEKLINGLTQKKRERTEEEIYEMIHHK